MGELLGSPPSEWTLTTVTEGERPLLLQLFEHYLYDFSKMEHADLDEDGRFVPPARPFVERYWTAPGRHALLLRVGGKPAGFVLVDERSPLEGGRDDHYIGAFFVTRAYRRRGHGVAMARAVFDRFPGRWQILEIARNPAAQTFWRRLIGEYVGGRYTERWLNEREVIQEFDTRDKVTP